MGGLEFKVLHMRGGVVRWFRVQRVGADAPLTQQPTRTMQLRLRATHRHA